MTTDVYTTAWEPCPACSGSGLENGLYGPAACSSCNGDVMVRVRDNKGRYTTREATP